MDKVSIIVCAYNEEKFIHECIESLIKQTYKNIEIIIVDDGSTDLTWEIIEKFASLDNRIVAIKHETNKGKVNAQNSAYKASSGKYIAICGGDDWYPCDRIESQINFIIENEADFTFGNMELAVTDESTGLNYVVGKLYASIYDLPTDWKDVLLGVSATCGTALFKKELANKIYPIPSNLPYEDRWITAISLLNGKVKIQNKILGTYRQHSGNSFGLLCCNTNFFYFLKKYKQIYSRNLIVNQELFNYIIKFHPENSKAKEIKLISDFLNGKSIGSSLASRVRYAIKVMTNEIPKHYLKIILIPEVFAFLVWRNAKKKYSCFELLKSQNEHY